MKINPNQKIYFDMDGVLADFSGKRKAVERFNKEKGFFQKLKPIKPSLKVVKRLINIGFDVNILTASPNTQADYDKLKWIEKHLPQLDLKKVIICRIGEDKADYVDVKNSVLIDDYTTNLIAWKQKGGLPLKYVNKRDSSLGRHIEYDIEFTTSLEKTLL